MILDQKDKYFMLGTLAALDIVFLHDQEVVASEIIRATDINMLVAVAKEDEYYNLDKLLAIVELIDSPLKEPVAIAPHQQSPCFAWSWDELLIG
jgi:hypothetical protein